MDNETSMYMFKENIDLINPSKIISSKPPENQPSFWCNWIPSKEGDSIRWNSSKYSYEYVKWLKYLIDNFLGPRGYVLNGMVRYYGDCTEEYVHLEVYEDDDWSEDSAADDFGEIIIINNVVSFTGPVGCWDEEGINNKKEDNKIEDKTEDKTGYYIKYIVYGIISIIISVCILGVY
jgi:hypothetical protein